MQNLLPKHFTKPKNLDETSFNDSDWLMPPLVDLCARLREPGQQQHGTLKTEGQAMRANGFLHVVIPPDTDPVLENGSLLKGLREKTWQDGGNTFADHRGVDCGAGR